MEVLCNVNLEKLQFISRKLPQYLFTLALEYFGSDLLFSGSKVDFSSVHRSQGITAKIGEHYLEMINRLQEYYDKIKPPIHDFLFRTRGLTRLRTQPYTKNITF